MANVTNTSRHPRVVYTKDGTVDLRPGETRNVALDQDNPANVAGLGFGALSIESGKSAPKREVTTTLPKTD